MLNVKKNITELIGNTPIIELNGFCKAVNIENKIYAKLEGFNPAGSAKDRVALSMIVDAEERGLIKKGAVIVEPTSGNTGIGLAAVATSRGYRVILTMPDTMSSERIRLLKAYGAETVLTKGELGMSGAIAEAQKIAKKYDNSFIPGQFDNMSNPKAHKTSTGPEIWRDMDNDVDVFIATVGTGGTLTGVGEYLKSVNPDVKIIAVEPENSPLLSKGVAGAHKIQGIGANFIPEVLNRDIIDEIITVSDEDAFSMSRLMAKSEGILVGISSGAALKAAESIAKKEQYKEKKIVVLLTDSGDRYLSTELFDY